MFLEGNKVIRMKYFVLHLGVFYPKISASEIRPDLERESTSDFDM